MGVVARRDPWSKGDGRGKIDANKNEEAMTMTKTSTSPVETLAPEQLGVNVTPPFSDIGARRDKLHEAILDEMDRQKRRAFQYRARPLGFAGSDIRFASSHELRVGARIIRDDGRVYEVCGAKKAKKRRVVLAPWSQGGGRGQ